VLVGMSERTVPAGVERLARRLFDGGEVSRIVAVRLPETRSMMHLDTVMTMVDPETFTKYAGLGMLPSYTVEPGDTEKELKVTDHPPEEMHDAIAAALGLSSIRVLIPEQDVHSAAREQWDDGCNALAVAPGVVVTYERNETANNHLRANGVEVLEIPGGELGRGRGGPRCMSCPVLRDPL
jgi:arginine deiminase